MMRLGPAGYPEPGRFVLAHESKRVIARLLIQAVEIAQLLDGELDAAAAVARRFRAVERRHLEIRLADAFGARVAHRLRLRSNPVKEGHRRRPLIRATATRRRRRRYTVKTGRGYGHRVEEGGARPAPGWGN